MPQSIWETRIKLVMGGGWGGKEGGKIKKQKEKIE